ncbi:MAG: putative 5-formyltetrahydrofolate cyclo-ligase [Firmicutes bacterium ADurb.Bin193]|nr:MAG: putative 5-formyltetrahydrofolate cyclo-ligase [Firmicutes bacterium ADurb.Bin193]
MDKKTLRRKILNLRNESDRCFRERADEQIFKSLVSDPNIKKAKTVMTYVSMGSEPDTHRLINRLLAEGKNVCVPVVAGRELDISYISSMDDLESGSYEILEPKKTAFRRCEPEDIDVFIVPAVAFDKNNHRIGYGAGFYDRLLPGTRGIKIGVCYSFCMVDNVCPEPHDRRVDYIITDLE